MLNKLTKEQEALIPAIKDEWIKFCLGGDSSVNRKMAMEGIRWMYGRAKLKSPFVIFVNGPMACQYAVWFLQAWMKNKKLTDQVKAQVGDQVKAQVGAQVWDQVKAQVGDQVGDQVKAQVWAQVWAQVGAQVWDQVKAQVGDQVKAQVGAQVGDQVKAQVGAQVWDQVKAQVGDQVGDQVKAQVWAQVWAMKKEFFSYSWCDLSDSGWLSFYDFFDRIGIKVTDDFRKYRDYAKSGYFMTILLNGFAIACPRPSIVHKNAEGRLHKDLAPAIEWEGEQYYFLNGVRVKKEHVLTPAEKIDVKEIIKEENAEIRRELIRKVGIERFIQKSKAKVLDNQGNYELLSVWLSDDVPDARYLKMINPSIGVFHVEGVEGNTVQEAIDFRAGRLGIKGNWKPAVLT